MRFFENQDRARRNTTLLVALFSAAVLIITLAVDVLIYIAASADQAAPPRFDAWLLSPPGLLCSGVTLGVMALGSVYRFFKLAGGGIQVARMAGARAIDMTTQNPQERRFINLVEEMAIASGIPVPHLFVMDREAAINAFVAGYEPGEAVLVVTRGALDQLTRDELQGVIGHEFSHILNGDMRLNVRLIAILAGILLIGQIGQVLMRSGGHRPRGKRNEGASVAMLGLALMGIGYIGLFFGRLIKSAIARQHEYLADASSVQFTRNPEGIGGALYKIALNDHRALLSHTHHAEDLNHLCFGESVRMQFMQGWLASHPPLEERISAIDAQLLAKLRARYGRRGERLSTHAAQATQTHHTATPPEVAMGFGGGTTQPVNPSLSSQTGQISPVSEHYAQSLLQRLPQTFKDLLHTTTGAVNLCYALALREAPSGLRAQSIAELPADGALRFERAQLEQIEQVLWDE
ncbi:MAG: M48 family metallopeptidase, partial [Gammaproteobacteria bacterium]|nr:M48 family metallopeptidase [Gammaproteobacteria bacterium]